MPPKSKVFSLPKELREALNARLVETGFKDYEALARWLNAELAVRKLTITISAMAVNRYGRRFDQKLAKLKLATDKARAIVEGAEDTEGALNDALVRIIQVENFELLDQLDNLSATERADILAKMNLAVARIVRASVAAKKWSFNARDLVREEAEKLLEEGYDADTLNELKRRVEIYLPDNERTQTDT